MYIELLKYEPNFSESMFKTKVDNILVMLKTAVMQKDIERVKHNISVNVYNKYNNYINELLENKQIQMYEQFNVTSTEILEVNVLEEKLEIKVLIVSKSIDYVLDEETGNIIKGQDQSRILTNNYMTFVKNKNSLVSGLVRKCPGCGASVDANYYGKCVYCDTSYNAYEYDWILEEITEKTI